MGSSVAHNKVVLFAAIAAGTTTALRFVPAPNHGVSRTEGDSTSMRNWLRTVLFISAFSPALITMAYVRYDIHGWRTDVLQFGVIGLIGSLIPFAIIKLGKV